jgi:hypothetical protein
VAVNPAENYLSAPQQLNSTGNVLGNYYVVVEELDALNSTTPADIRDFVFASVITDAASSDTIESTITNGLPEGFYRVTVNTHAANHQPVLVPISQHGSLNDAAYFTVTADGTAGSVPSVRRRTPNPNMERFYGRSPSTAPRTVIPRATADDQSSLTLLSSVVASGFANNGLDTATSGHSASLTSTNNFINFCATTTLPLTSGTQVRTGFCNPAPMGVLPAATLMPSSKFTYPRNGDILAPNAPLTVGLAVTNFATGNFANEETSFMAAPQQLDSSGRILGHPFIVFEQFSPGELDTTDPTTFTLFKGIQSPADSTGVVTTTLAGLPTGFYRVTSMLATANGQPLLLPVIQHGAVDDTIYITVVEGGALPTNQTSLSSSPSPTSTRATTIPGVGTFVD